MGRYVEIAEKALRDFREGKLTPNSEPPTVCSEKPTSLPPRDLQPPAQLSFELIKEVFPEAQILGPDATDWEAHRRRIQALEEAKKPGCWNCGGLRFWTWPGGAKRCARCHPLLNQSVWCG